MEGVRRPAEGGSDEGGVGGGDGGGGDGGGGDAGLRDDSARTVRMSVEEHRCLVDTLRACVAAADAASALLFSCGPPEADALATKEVTDGNKTAPSADAQNSAADAEDRQHYLQSLALLEKQRSDLLRMLSQALESLEQITDAQGRRAEESNVALPNHIAERRTSAALPSGSRKKRRARGEPPAERRHKSNPEIGAVIAQRSQSSIRSRKQRYSRRRERDRRCCKRTCGIIRVVVRKRQAESEPERPKEDEYLNEDDEAAVKNDLQNVNAKECPRADKNNKWEIQSTKRRISRRSTRTNSPVIKTKLSQISERKLRAKRIKSSLDKLLESRGDNTSSKSSTQYQRGKDSMNKKRSPFITQMCAKHSRTKTSENSKVALLRTCSKVLNAYKDDKKISDGDQGYDKRKSFLNPVSRISSARLLRNSKVELGSSRHNQFQVIMF